jgi:hypothetical protein
MRNLGVGSSGQDVRALQQTLAAAGYNPGPVDGIFGPQTRAAVVAMQRDLGVAADGIVGPQTRGAMGNLQTGPDSRDLSQRDEGGFDPVRAARQDREANRAAMRAVVSWLPSQLIDIYVNEWVKSGQSELAWAMVRTSKPYDQYFPSIRREDGTLRMSEQDYVSHKDAFQRELRQWGLNPEMFEGRHAQLVEGEVSVQEFRQRIDAKATGVLQNLPEIRQRFGEFYGISDLSDEALIASALDPDVGRAVLQGRITAAQISGEAQRMGFDRGREASERLAQAGGLTDQMRAREFYATAGQVVPRMERFSQRFETGRPGFGIEQYEEAGLFGATELQRRMRRLHASEMAMFQQGPSVTMDQGGAFTGLTRR